MSLARWRQQCFLSFILLLAPGTPSKTPELAPHCVDEEMACFSNTKCLMPNNLDDDLMFKKKVDNDCNAQIDIRPYNDKKALIRLKAKEAPVKLVEIATPEVEIFGCETFSGGKKVRRIGGKDLFYGELWQGSGIACEFLYESESPMSPLKEANKVFAIQYGNDKKVKGAKGDFFSPMNNFLKCDMDWLDNSFENDNKYAYLDADRRYNAIICPDPSQQLVYEKLDDDGVNSIKVAAGGIVCTKTTTMPEKWRYEVFPDTKTTQPALTIDKKTQVACRSLVCRQCSKTPPACPTTGKCSPPKIEKEGECDVLKCDGDRIKVNGGTAVIGKGVCGPHKISDESGTINTVSRWTFGGKAIESMNCVDKISCQDVSPLKLGEGNVEGLSLNGLKIECAANRKIIIASDGPTNDTNIIQCDQSNGDWYFIRAGGDKISVSKGSTLTCEAIETTTEAVVGASLGPIEYSAIGGGLIIIAAAVAILIYCIKCKKNKNKQKKVRTITDKSTAAKSPEVKTALPVGYVPPTLVTTSSSDPAPPPFVPDPNLNEKTAISTTPEPKSLIMKTAMSQPTTQDQDPDQEPSEGVQPQDPPEQQNGPPVRKYRKLQSCLPKKKKPIVEDTSEAPILRLDKNYQEIPLDEEHHVSVKKSEQSKSDPEAKPAAKKPADTGRKPQTFPLNEKEEKIRKGVTCKPAEYPTLQDIMSDWSDGKKKPANKTVNTAVTPDVPPTVDPTQGGKTMDVTKKTEEPVEGLLTQLDTTVEQKEADKKNKK